MGFGRVVLFGRSSGAVRVVRYQAERQDPRVAGLVLGSPPMHPRFDTRRYPEAVALAERLVAEGRGDDLLPASRLGPP